MQLYRARAPMLDPADYGTFEAFHAELEATWVAAWRRAHALRDEHPDGYVSGAESEAALL